jgi:hypothetical protein
VQPQPSTVLTHIGNSKGSKFEQILKNFQLSELTPPQFSIKTISVLNQNPLSFQSNPAEFGLNPARLVYSKSPAWYIPNEAFAMYQTGIIPMRGDTGTKYTKFNPKPKS